MKTEIYNVNFEKSAFLNEYVELFLNEKVKTLYKDEVLSVQVWVKIENSFLKRGKDSYLCEVKIHTKSLGSFFSKEKDVDCYDACKVALSEVLAMIQKKVKQRAKNDRRMTYFLKRLPAEA